MNTLIDTDLPRPLAAISSGSSVCICFSVARGRLLTLAHRCNSGTRTLGGVPRIRLRLGSGSVCNRGKHVRAVDKIMSHGANATDLHTMFPGGGKLLCDKASKGIVLPIAVGKDLIVPRTAAFRVRSVACMCGIISNGTRSTPIDIAHMGKKRRCVIGSKLGRKSVVITRNMNLLHRNAPIGMGRGWRRGRFGGLCEAPRPINYCFCFSDNDKCRQTIRFTHQAVS